MSKIGLDNNIWILVCDGRKALVLQNVGDRVYPKLETRETFEHPEHAGHDLGTDAPGRTHSSSESGRRSSVESPDLHRLADEEFLRQVAHHLDRSVIADRIKKLILVAPPRAMGVLRPLLSASVRKVVVAEVEKDYLRQPLYEIETHLSRHFADLP